MPSPCQVGLTQVVTASMQVTPACGVSCAPGLGSLPASAQVTRGVSPPQVLHRPMVATMLHRRKTGETWNLTSDPYEVPIYKTTQGLVLLLVRPEVTERLKNSTANRALGTAHDTRLLCRF